VSALRARTDSAVEAVKNSLSSSDEVAETGGPRMPPLVDRFHRVGTSRPVELEESERGPLLLVVAQWAKEVGAERLPAGIGDLLGVLQGGYVPRVGWENRQCPAPVALAPLDI
jgi:hypothetical protein